MWCTVAEYTFKTCGLKADAQFLYAHFGNIKLLVVFVKLLDSSPHPQIWNNW